jgi:hypothetical protein
MHCLQDFWGFVSDTDFCKSGHHGGDAGFVRLCIAGGELQESCARPGGDLSVLWNVFGLVLLAKPGFFTRIWHYGFVLAMPAFAGAVYLFEWLRQWIEDHYDRVYPAPDPVAKFPSGKQPFSELQILKWRTPILPAVKN